VVETFVGPPPLRLRANPYHPEQLAVLVTSDARISVKLEMPT